jgi:cell division transport system permease protein
LKNYLSLTISISFVLFLVGFLGLILLNSKKVADYFKEQIIMTVYLKDITREIESAQLQKRILLDKATKKVNFISKEEGGITFANEIGEDFVEFLGYNPLLNSIDIYFNASFVNKNSLNEISRSIGLNDFVSHVVFDEPLINLLDKNIKKISYLLLGTTIIFIIVALLLIDSSIRLSIYSKRFIIKTMQLVGAKKSFITKPFIIKHIRIGFISSFFAITSLSFLFYKLNLEFPELKMTNNYNDIIFVLLGVFLLGISISFTSTYFATQRYLNLKTEAIY